jgi:hypothetical protein
VDTVGVLRADGVAAAVAEVTPGAGASGVGATAIPGGGASGPTIGASEAAIATSAESAQHANASATAIQAPRGRRIHASRSILLSRSLPKLTI